MIDIGGQLPDLSITVRNAAGVPENATSCTLTITLPDLTTVTPAVSNPSAGVYTASYLTVQAGRHHARWVTTGSNADAKGYDYDVQPADAGGIVSLGEVKTHLGKTSSTDDEQLREFIAAATVIIEDDPEIGIGPVVIRTFVERHYPGWSLSLWRTPVVSITSVDPWLNWGVSYNPSDLIFDPDTGIVEVKSGLPFFGGPLKVTYKAGRTVIAANVTLGAKEMIKHWWEGQRRGSQPGSRGMGSRAGTSTGETYVTSSGYLIPNRVAQMLRAMRTPAGFR
jgi:hypothetical protein